MLTVLGVIRMAHLDFERCLVVSHPVSPPGSSWSSLLLGSMFLETLASSLVLNVPNRSPTYTRVPTFALHGSPRL